MSQSSSKEFLEVESTWAAMGAGGAIYVPQDLKWIAPATTSNSTSANQAQSVMWSEDHHEFALDEALVRIGVMRERLRRWEATPL